MGFWNEIRSKIKDTIDLVQKNPVLDAFASSALESIPVVGGILVKLYDNSKESPEDKTGQILQILSKMQEMNDESLEKFCRGLEQNKAIILENQAYLKKISADTLSIMDKLDDARKEIITDVKRVENKIDKLYEIIQQSKIEVLENPKNIDEPNTFSDPDFRISWPEGWEKIEQKEILETIEKMDEAIIEKYGMQDIGKDAFALRKKTGEMRRPNINIIKDAPMPDIKEYIDLLHQYYEEELGWSVVKADYDKIMGIGTLEAKNNVQAFTIQKFYFRKEYTLIITITQITQDQLDEDPAYADEVTQILQSLVFLS